MLIIGASNAAADRFSASAKNRTPGGRHFPASTANRGLPEDVLKDEIPAAGIKKQTGGVLLRTDEMVEAARIELASEKRQQQTLRACLIHFESHQYLCKLAMPDTDQLLNFANPAATSGSAIFHQITLLPIARPGLKENRLQRSQVN